jgi:hypothetical protein
MLDPHSLDHPCVRIDTVHPTPIRQQELLDDAYRWLQDRGCTFIRTTDMSERRGMLVVEGWQQKPDPVPAPPYDLAD